MAADHSDSWKKYNSLLIHIHQLDEMKQKALNELEEVKRQIRKEMEEEIRKETHNEKKTHEEKKIVEVNALEIKIPGVNVAEIESKWIRPKKGEARLFIIKGVTYMRDHDDVIWTINKNQEAEEILGVWDEEKQIIDDSVEIEIEDD